MNKKNKFKIGDFVIKDGLEYVDGMVGIPFTLVKKRGKIINIFQGPKPFTEILVVRMDNGEEFSDQFDSFEYDIERIRDGKIDDIAGIV